MPVGISGDDDDDTPRSYSLAKRRNCSYPFSTFSDGLPRLSLSYHKLPPNQLKLSVVKLDGSSFDVQVAGNATVGELKQAVEDVFIQSPKEGEGKISWSHVWGHFCLSYEGQKLTYDKYHVRSFGIKDGDQLHFIRHLSINYNVVKRRSKRRNVSCKEQPFPFAGSISEKEEGGDGNFNGDRHDEDSNSDRHDEHSNSDQHDEDSNSDQHDEDIKYYNYENEGDEESIGDPEFKLAHFLKGWFSYSTLWFVGRPKSEGKTRPSRFSGQFLKLGSKMSLTRL